MNDFDDFGGSLANEEWEQRERYEEKQMRDKKKKLKPCPFCGGEAECSDNAVMQDGKFKWATECLNCGCITYSFDTEKEAIEAWNRRDENDL